MKTGFALFALLGGAVQAQGWQPYSPALVAQANAGDPAAQYALGEAYRSGNGVQADREQAITWFRKAALRDTRAADGLGVLLFVKGERKQAIPLLQAASQRGNAQALYILGTARFNGDYVPKDLGAAYAEMRLAANKGLPEAQRSLQLMEPYVQAADRARADQLAAQPSGPETGPLPVPPPPLARAKASPPIKTARTPMIAATTPASVSAPELPAAASTIPAPMRPMNTRAPTVPTPVLPQRAPLATIELPPPQTTPSTPLKAANVAPLIHTTQATAPKPAIGSWRVQLAAVGSAAAAEAEWKRLKTKAPDLAVLGHAAVSVGAITRLQATGIASKADASALCQKLAAIGLACFVVAAPTP